MFEERLTMAPLDGAGPLNAMVTAALDPAVTLVGAIVRDCTVGWVGEAWQMFEGTETLTVLESVVPAMFFAWTKYE